MLVSAGGRAAILDLDMDPALGRARATWRRAALIPTDVSGPDQVEGAAEAIQPRSRPRRSLRHCAGVDRPARVRARDGTMFRSTRSRAQSTSTRRPVRRHPAVRPVDGRQRAERGRRARTRRQRVLHRRDRGAGGQAAYSASNRAIIALTLTLARDLGSRGLRVLTICAGIFDARMVAGADEKVRSRWRPSRSSPSD